MKKIIVLLSSILFLVLACESESQSSKKEKSIMYEATPLALLMLKMHGDAYGWKEGIQNDIFEVEFPSDYYGIYTVEATDSNVRNEVFIEHADAYMENVKDLIGTQKQKKQVKKFNTMIASCVDCHAVFCQGPIDKIEKLYIVEE